MTISPRSADSFCAAFDLSCRIPVSMIDAACDVKRLMLLNPTMDNDGVSLMDVLLKQIKHVLATAPSTQVVRLCIVNIGSPAWGEYCPAVGNTFIF